MFAYTTIIALILCATLVLTSSVSKSETADGTSKKNHHVFSVKSFHDDGNNAFFSNISSSMTDIRVKNESRSTVMAEGGPIYQIHSADSSSHLAKSALSDLATPTKAIEQTSDVTKSSDSKSKLPKTRNASVVARKGVLTSSKITARKGVGPESSSPKESSIESIDEAISQIPSRAKNNEDEKIHSSVDWIIDGRKMTTEKTPLFGKVNVDLSTNTTSNNASNVSTNEAEKFKMSSTIVKLVVPTIATKIIKNTTITSSPSTKRFKAKPTVTIGEMDIDKPIPASPTKTPPLGMPRKIDYIVPVIITIMALPLLGGATFFIYRRGRDCWDKRHYRRMDFLIDGMYNDYSWK